MIYNRAQLRGHECLWGSVGQAIVFCGLPLPYAGGQATKNDRLPHVSCIPSEQDAPLLMRRCIVTSFTGRNPRGPKSRGKKMPARLW